MSPGIGLMDRRLKTEKDAISLATSGILKKYKTKSEKIKTLETKYDDDAGDWYVALGWDDKRAIVKMDSVQATITNIEHIQIHNMIKLPDFSNPFENENNFYLTCDLDRIKKILVQYELYKKIELIPGSIIECGVFKGNSAIRFMAYRKFLNNLI